jgi:hypothetical protein
MEDKKATKKALWVSEDMHTEINIFAATNRTDIGRATEMLIKLGMISHGKDNV